MKVVVLGPLVIFNLAFNLKVLGLRFFMLAIWDGVW